CATSCRCPSASRPMPYGRRVCRRRDTWRPAGRRLDARLASLTRRCVDERRQDGRAGPGSGGAVVPLPFWRPTRADVVISATGSTRLRWRRIACRTRAGPAVGRGPERRSVWAVVSERLAAGRRGRHARGTRRRGRNGVLGLLALEEAAHADAEGSEQGD